MNDYWGAPEKEYEISLLQFAQVQLSEKGYSVMDEKVEVCSGAGAMTLSGILKKKETNFGIYIHDGPKKRKTRGPPIIRVLSLLPDMKNVEDLRNYELSHPDFYDLLLPEEAGFRERVEEDIKEIYTNLYNSKIKDLYDSDRSSAADILRMRLRKGVITDLI
ncbi:MAG: hypothetical protein OIN87_03395 [Candidatus Methanoperedens sp.]|nr:hypothetical protein [Candidatus Methanoperedens sp.]